MKIKSILFVLFAFAIVSLLFAQEQQPTTTPNAAPAVASPATAPTSGVSTEPGATSGGQPLVTNAPPAGKSPEGRADSEKKPVREGNPDPAQNLIEYGGAG